MWVEYTVRILCSPDGSLRTTNIEQSVPACHKRNVSWQVTNLLLYVRTFPPRIGVE